VYIYGSYRKILKFIQKYHFLDDSVHIHYQLESYRTLWSTSWSNAVW